MGVLEDAIREHLELKRRHGASDEELEEQEAEALGPARRGFEAPADEAEIEEEAAPIEQSAAEPQESSTEIFEEPLLEEDETEPALEEIRPESAEGTLEAPDFLQETPWPEPETREQRPPRDFDFD